MSKPASWAILIAAERDRVSSSLPWRCWFSSSRVLLTISVTLDSSGVELPHVRSPPWSTVWLAWPCSPLHKDQGCRSHSRPRQPFPRSLPTSALGGLERAGGACLVRSSSFSLSRSAARVVASCILRSASLWAFSASSTLLYFGLGFASSPSPPCFSSRFPPPLSSAGGWTCLPSGFSFLIASDGASQFRRMAGKNPLLLDPLPDGR